MECSWQLGYNSFSLFFSLFSLPSFLFVRYYLNKISTGRNEPCKYSPSTSCPLTAICAQFSHVSRGTPAQTGQNQQNVCSFPASHEPWRNGPMTDASCQRLMAGNRCPADPAKTLLGIRKIDSDGIFPFVQLPISLCGTQEAAFPRGRFVRSVDQGIYFLANQSCSQPTLCPLSYGFKF